ncbi:hypothetical protein CEXT_416611 [Caerostris extrusa]|uniref:Uncharacterized protein n=1 Tax=Caerostris extrusa TaxID=172846 RepID=A0AAV4N6M0_CAEEX|nr:hypothetical protein CEXT_416611 [Caerostris extrusa]
MHYGHKEENLNMLFIFTSDGLHFKRKLSRLTTYEACITAKLSSQDFSSNRKDSPYRKNLLCFFILCGERHFSITLKWASICDGRKGDPVIIHQRLIGHLAGSDLANFIHSGFGEKKKKDFKFIFVSEELTCR